MTEIKKKKDSLSNPCSIWTRPFFLVFKIFKTRRSLVSLRSFDSLPILVNLTSELNEPELRILSKGTIAIKSMVNQPFRYLFEIWVLLRLMDRSSMFMKAVLKQTTMSIIKRMSTVWFVILQNLVSSSARKANCIGSVTQENSRIFETKIFHFIRVLLSGLIRKKFSTSSKNDSYSTSIGFSFSFSM